MITTYPGTKYDPRRRVIVVLDDDDLALRHAFYAQEPVTYGGHTFRIWSLSAVSDGTSTTVCYKGRIDP